jgi:hypothetical protein
MGPTALSRPSLVRLSSVSTIRVHLTPLSVTHRSSGRTIPHMNDEEAIRALQKWRSHYEDLRAFAATVSRLQVDVVRAVAEHIAALERVAHVDDPSAGQLDWPASIEGCAAELGRLFDALTEASDDAVFAYDELPRLLERHAA